MTDGFLALTIFTLWTTVNQDDDLSGPSGLLLRALLAQLFNSHIFRIRFTSNTEYHELQQFDTICLCALFSKFIIYLPPGFVVVVCVIDGVSFYKTADWAEDLRTILETLNSLMRDPKVYAVFKVLVTSAMASREATRYIPPQDHLMLPLDAGDGANSPLTARQLKMQARRSVGSHARDQSPESLQSSSPKRWMMTKGLWTESLMMMNSASEFDRTQLKMNHLRFVYEKLRRWVWYSHVAYSHTVPFRSKRQWA